MRNRPRPFGRRGGGNGESPGKVATGIGEDEGDIVVLTGNDGGGIEAAEASAAPGGHFVGQNPVRDSLKGACGGISPCQRDAGFGLGIGIMSGGPCEIVGAGVVGQEVFLPLFIVEEDDVRTAVGGNVVMFEYIAGVKAPAQVFP